MYDEIQQTEKSHSKSSSVEKILVGSLMENTTVKAESDRDYLFVNKDIICVADPCYITEDDVCKEIFLVDFENAPHGYTLLRQLQRGGAKSVIGGCLIKKDKALYLSSDLFMNTVEPGSYLGQRERNGPALTMKDSLSKILLWFYKNAKTKSKPNYDVDIVNAFPCKMPVPLKTWARRIRNKHWPSPVVANEVLLLPVYVVPASQVGTENTDLQWRVSFTRQETHLIQTFSNTQLKVLILAKKIAKYKLRYHCKEITSYVIKNVVFWVFEETPPDQFQVTDLIERLRDVLSQLSDFISKRCLPAYINPDKNLFYGKINATEHNELLSELIKCQSVLTEEFHKCCSRGERSQDEYFGPMFQDMLESLLGPLSQDIMLPHLKELCKDMAETQNVVPQDTENRDKNVPATVSLLESMMKFKDFDISVIDHHVRTNSPLFIQIPMFIFTTVLVFSPIVLLAYILHCILPPYVIISILVLMCATFVITRKKLLVIVRLLQLIMTSVCWISKIVNWIFRQIIRVLPVQNELED